MNDKILQTLLNFYIISIPSLAFDENSGRLNKKSKSMKQHNDRNVNVIKHMIKIQIELYCIKLIKSKRYHR